MEQALFDSGSREKVRENFRRRFGDSTDSAQAIAERVRDIVDGIK